MYKDMSVKLFKTNVKFMLFNCTLVANNVFIDVFFLVFFYQKGGVSVVH